MAYAWNGLLMLKGNEESCSKVLTLIQEEQEKLETKKRRLSDVSQSTSSFELPHWSSVSRWKLPQHQMRGRTYLDPPCSCFILDSLSESSKGKKSKESQSFNYYDDYCLLQMLKGACLRYSGKPMQAELCLLDIREK